MRPWWWVSAEWYWGRAKIYRLKVSGGGGRGVSKSKLLTNLHCFVVEVHPDCFHTAGVNNAHLWRGGEGSLYYLAMKSFPLVFSPFMVFIANTVLHFTSYILHIISSCVVSSGCSSMNTLTNLTEHFQLITDRKEVIGCFLSEIPPLGPKKSDVLPPLYIYALARKVMTRWNEENSQYPCYDSAIWIMEAPHKTTFLICNLVADIHWSRAVGQKCLINIFWQSLDVFDAKSPPPPRAPFFQERLWHFYPGEMCGFKKAR